MTGRPLVSVCVTTRNQRKYIVQCIGSVLEQRGDFELEVLVGDDASTDGTGEVVAALATRHPDVVHHVAHAAQVGASANTKSLVARARGAYIARLDGDDYWLPGKLVTQLVALEDDPSCAAVYANALAVDLDGRPLGVFNDAGNLRIDLAGLLRGGNFLNNSSMLCRAAHRTAWLAMEDPLLDYRVHLMHALHGDLLHMAEPLVVYRVASRGSMVAEANAHVRELYWQAITSVPRERIADGDLARGQADFLRRVAFRALRTLDAGLVRQWVSRVLAASPFGALRTSVMVCDSIMRAAMREVAGWASHHLRGTPRVLYRR